LGELAGVRAEVAEVWR
jgi:hypothetical protein